MITKNYSKITSPRSVITSPHSIRHVFSNPQNLKLSNPKSPGTKSPNSKPPSVKISNTLNILNLRINAVNSGRKTRQKTTPVIVDILNTIKKKPGKTKYRRNFVGNSRTNHIIGLIRRKEITEDKYRFSDNVNNIVQKDKERKLKTKTNSVFGNKRKSDSRKSKTHLGFFGKKKGRIRI